VRARQGLDAAINGGDIGIERVRLGKPDDRLDEGERVLRAMIDLPRKQRLPILGVLALGDVDRHPAQAHDLARLVGAGRRCADAPAKLATGPSHPELDLVRAGLAQKVAESLLQQAQVLGGDEGRDVIEVDDEGLRVDAEDAVLPLVPAAIGLGEVPVPGAHLAGRQCEVAPLLALADLCRGRLQLPGSFGDARFQLAIELLELAGLPVQLGEDAHLGAQHLRDDGDRHIVDRPHLVSAQEIEFRQVDGRDEDDRRLLEPRVVPDHRSELKPVEVGHADVHQHDGDIIAQELIERVTSRGRLEQRLVERLEDYLIAQELRRLVVDEKDVDPVVAVHARRPISGATTCEVQRGAARC
jgi:hypothetical protein